MKGQDSLLSQIRKLSGETGSTSDTDALEQHAVDGSTPQVVVFPEDESAVSRVLSWADSKLLPIIPYGGGTAVDLGGLPPDDFICLDLTRMANVVDLDAKNLTVTVQAGTKLANLKEILAEKGLFLPLDPPYQEHATVGGVLAANSTGPFRLLHGSPRDFVLGMRVVLPNGTVIKCGGKTVKNVAGYDLPKLFIGSLGTAGVIVEATMRLIPLPEERASLWLTFEELDAAVRFADTLLHGNLFPAALELLDAAAADRLARRILQQPAEWVVVVAFEGFAETVRRQTEEISSSHGSPTLIDGDKAEQLWTDIRNFVPEDGDVVRLKIAVPLSRLQAAVSAAGDARLRLAHAGSGIVYVVLGEAHGSLAARINQLRWDAGGMDGFLTLEKAPRGIKVMVDVWDFPGKSIQIMRRIRKSFDPNSIVNRGRFLSDL